jgi:hypothetical protein
MTHRYGPYRQSERGEVYFCRRAGLMLGRQAYRALFAGRVDEMKLAGKRRWLAAVRSNVER